MALVGAPPTQSAAPADAVPLNKPAPPAATTPQEGREQVAQMQRKASAMAAATVSAVGVPGHSTQAPQPCQYHDQQR